jgi:dephospho-CoA kinase
MKIGITGGIGSGKSYVCKLLREQGIEVFDCDSAAKKLMLTSADIREKLTDLIGPGTYDAEGNLNKSMVSQFLLSSQRNVKAVNEIVHPAVFDEYRSSGLDYMESAIIFESGAYKLVDKVVCVIAPKETRINRVMERDHITREQVLQWMNRQLNQKEMIRKSDYVIINDGETDLDKQISKIVRQCNKQF